MSGLSSGPFEFDFVPRSVDGALARFVQTIWYARGTVPYERERIAPTGSTVAVLVLGDPILETPNNGEGETLCSERGFLIGPHVGPTINQPTGETYAIGIVTTPVGCEATFGIEPSSIRGRVVDLDTIWNSAGTLRESLLAMSDPKSMLDEVMSTLTNACGAPPSGFDRCRAAVALLEAEPARPIADIAHELSVSHGHLDHEFTRVVGLTPRTLARLLRMRRLLAGLDVTGVIEWGRLATEQGWFDQANLIRDFKRHTGVTPSQYVAAQTAAFSPVHSDDAVGFVPEF